MSQPTFKRPFTRIKDSFSETRRLPRLGKIRLGIKKKSLKSGNEYPSETEFFVCPPEVQEVYGPEPTQLDVMFPVDDPEVVFSQQLAWFGSSAGLRCHGDKERALRLVDEKLKKWEERTCPCEQLKTLENPKGECTEQSHLMVILPKVSMGGVWQITTRSFHSTVTLNSAIDYIRFLTGGKLAMIPLKLRREPRETHHDGKRQVHWTLNLVFDYDLATVQKLIERRAQEGIAPAYQIDGPVDENPKTDPVDEVTDEEGPTDGPPDDTRETEEIADVQRTLAGEDAQEPPAEDAGGDPAEAQQLADHHTVVQDYKGSLKHSQSIENVNTLFKNQIQREKAYQALPKAKQDEVYEAYTARLKELSVSQAKAGAGRR